MIVFYIVSYTVYDIIVLPHIDKSGVSNVLNDLIPRGVGMNESDKMIYVWPRLGTPADSDTINS